MRPRIFLAILLTAGFLLVLPSSAAQAQITRAEAKCRKTIAKETAKYVKLAQKNVVKCHKLFDSGKASGDSSLCNDPLAADSKSKLSRQASKLRAKIGGAKDVCSDAGSPLGNVLAEYGRCPAPAESSDDGGATDGTDTFSELAECLIAHADQLLQSTARTILGTPSLPMSAEQAKCHGALAKRYTRVIDTIAKGQSKCQAGLDKQGGAIGFACAGADPGGKIAKATQKLTTDIAKACAAAVGPRKRAIGIEERILGLGSCAETVSGLQGCVSKAVSVVGGGLGSMAWDWAGVCPTGGSYKVLPVVTDTELDVGWSGRVHDLAPILGHKGAVFSISCNADCTSCATTVTPPEENCRCSEDASVLCASDLDCAGVCQCFFGPPTPTSGAGTSVCVMNKIDGGMVGVVAPLSGDLDLEVSMRVVLYLGQELSRPCPTCDNDVCNGGPRDGLACSADGADPTFGEVSHDCPPSILQNVSGAGTRTAYTYSTGAVSLPFGTPCDGAPGNCACAVCTGNAAQVCNDDFECLDAGAGTCTGSLSAARKPNSCTDLICSPDAGAPTEGTCLAGPVDSYCDGFVYPTGQGVLSCSSDADCQSSNPSCPGGNCGNCTLSKNRECYLDPIQAQGISHKRVVGVGCFGGTSIASMNGAAGWPGAYRVQQNLSLELLCPDGVTQFQPPGGVNCP